MYKTSVYSLILKIKREYSSKNNKVVYLSKKKNLMGQRYSREYNRLSWELRWDSFFIHSTQICGQAVYSDHLSIATTFAAMIGGRYIQV